MSRRATVEAPANIAFIKYWGVADRERTLPANPSLSMTLSRCVSRTTVEHLEEEGDDEVLVGDGTEDGGGRFAPATGAFRRGVVDHLARLARHAGAGGRFRVATVNSFPAGTGMASSASGFAALTLAAAAALGWELSDAEASRWARASGSGSAARSVLGGYVQWPAPGGGPDAPAEQVAPASHWELADVVAVVEREAKAVSSREGHRRAVTSPYFPLRQELLPERLAATRRALEARDFAAFAPLLEEEAVELHLIAMSSRPPIFYWRPATVAVLAAARRLRADDGVAVAATMDAGANVHLVCPEAEAERVADAAAAVPGVLEAIRDRVGAGPRRLEEHLW